MCKYDICILAYPSGSRVEEILDETFMNKLTEDDILYCAKITDVNMNNVPEELGRYLKEGFKEEESDV